MEPDEQARGPKVEDLEVVSWPPELALAWAEGKHVELTNLDIKELDKV